MGGTSEAQLMTQPSHRITSMSVVQDVMTEWIEIAQFSLQVGHLVSNLTS